MSTAAILCSELPVYNTVAEQKCSSKQFWLLALSFVFFAVRGVFSFQTGDNEVGGFSPGSVATRSQGIVGHIVFPGIAYSIVMWLIISNWREVLTLLMRFKALTLLGSLAILSTLWSQDPMRSAVNGTFFLIGTLFAYALVSRFRPEQIMNVTCMTGYIVALLGLFLVIAFPQFGITHNLRDAGEWRGIFLDKSAAGKALTFMLSPVIAFWSMRFSFRRIFYAILMALMIFETHSATARLVLVAYSAFVVVVAVARRLGLRLSLAALLPAGLVGIPFASIAIANLPDVLRSLGRDPTLTGRTVIWNLVMLSILKRPMLGYGYYAFWLELRGESGRIIEALNWTFGYAHNGILEIALQLGFVGVLLFAVTLFQALRNAWTCIWLDTAGDYDWYIGIIFITIIYNIDEATVVLPHDLTSVLYVIACCGLARAAAELRQARIPDLIKEKRRDLSLT